jgi:general stress protein CsbA
VERQSRNEKKHIVTKDVVGLLLGEIVSTKKTHIVAKDVVGLLVGDSKNDSLTKMKTY